MATWTFKDGQKELVELEFLAAQLAGGWSLEDPKTKEDDLDTQIEKVEVQGKALTEKYEALLVLRDERDEKVAEEARLEAEKEAAAEKAKAQPKAKSAQKKSAQSKA